MGNFYVNHTVRAPQDRVVALLNREGRTAFVSPTAEGLTVVYDHECDTQNTFAITDLGRKMSESLNGPVVAFLNHDDDILCYWVFENGEVIEEYNSCPDYFEDEEGMDYPEDMDDSEEGPGYTTDGTELCRLFGNPRVRRRVQSILTEPGAAFVSMTHHDLARTLGLPEWVVGTGYRYIAQRDAIIGQDQCVHVGQPARARHGHDEDEDADEE
jgi:hypothetical protein